MLINAKQLQEVLAKALFGKEWQQYKKFVVHKQGNLANAQQMYNSEAFFTYYTSLFEKKTINATSLNGVHTCNVVYTLHLQCIGKCAEDLMLTTLFWDEREDVRTLLAALNSTLLETPRTIVSSPYFQDGANTILSYETVFKISCALTISEELPSMPELILTGSLQDEPIKEN